MEISFRQLESVDIVAILSGEPFWLSISVNSQCRHWNSGAIIKVDCPDQLGSVPRSIVPRRTELIQNDQFLA